MSPEELFEEIETHLLLDKKPSEYLEIAGESELFGQFPFVLLNRMKNTSQSPKYHPEGNVWIHTMMVVDQAAKRRGQSTKPRAFMWAALLHDIGKPPTTRRRRGKITSYDHDREGEKLARELLLTFTEDREFIETVCGLVRFHMQILSAAKGCAHVQLKEMRHQVDIREVALLGYCDRMGRTGANDEKELVSIREFLRICGVQDTDFFKPKEPF